MRKVLNVGGNSKNIPLPDIYNGWEHILLDIDPRGRPDVVCDARDLCSLPCSEYDAVYCSHNLEHFYKHDVSKALLGFLHVMKHDGFVQIKVPDIGRLMRIVVEQNFDIEDVLYQSPAGPITALDMIYGFGMEIERSGQDFFAHKTGFTEKSLISILQKTGFAHIFVCTGNLELSAFAFQSEPSEYYHSLLKLPE